MADSPTPSEIFDRAVEEGERRLDQSLLELVSTSFIAGFTVVFGVVALGIVEAMVSQRFDTLAKLAGALTFGIALVFLIIGRTELFNENFADPVAAAVDDSIVERAPSVLRLWTVTLVFNLAGGLLFALVFTVEGALPPGTSEALVHYAEETGHRGAQTWFARGIAGGTLLGLLSFLLVAVDSAESRISLSYVVGFLLALGPFDHVVVTILHVVFGMLFGANITVWTLGVMTVVVTAGNLVGGLGLVTVTHVTQAMGARESGD